MYVNENNLKTYINIKSITVPPRACPFKHAATHAAYYSLQPRELRLLVYVARRVWKFYESKMEICVLARLKRIILCS